MALPLLLDSSILAQVVRPAVEEYKPIVAVLNRLLEDTRFEVSVPEIIDYELRRKLLHVGNRRHHGKKWALDALAYLDELVAVAYIPLTTGAMRLAATLWAQTRADGQVRGTEERLDVDVILAAQAQQAGGQIITTNERHFWRIADVFDFKGFAER
jgi:predicted nucleic acid-binding protein